MRRWSGGISALLVLAATIAVAQLWPEPDFAPFVMTIEDWTSAKMGFSDGRVIEGTTIHRLDYRSRDEWTLTLVSETPVAPRPPQPVGYACRSGTYGHITTDGMFAAQSTDPRMCSGVGRWIHYGIAWSYPWKKEIDGEHITYTDPGERVVFDRVTGLPLLYEAGLTRGYVGQRTVFRVAR